MKFKSLKEQINNASATRSQTSQKLRRAIDALTFLGMEQRIIVIFERYYNSNLTYNNNNTYPIFSFSYNPKYYSTRQLAYELGVGDDNGWIYEDEDDWVT